MCLWLLAARDDNFEPIGKLHTLDDLWQLVVAVSLRQVFCAPSTSLKTKASAVLFERQPFARIVLWRTVAKVIKTYPDAPEGDR